MGNALTREVTGVAREVAAGGGLSRLRAFAEALKTEGLDEAQFHQFLSLAKLEARRPTPELAQLIDELLDDERLREKRIGEERVRAGLLEVQQALGFPWALQIAPEDLGLLAPRPSHLGYRSVTGFIAILAGCFNGAFGLMTLREFPIAFFFITGLLHAIATLFASYSFSSRRLLRALGWMWLCGPAFTLWMLTLTTAREAPTIATLGVAFSFPSMLTAWLALGLSGQAPE